MPKGGARMGSGPPPDPTALRRDRPSDKDGWTLLPSGGRQGTVPPWPLSPLTIFEDPDECDKLAARESQVWADLWRTPQAVAWERNGWTHDVAVYTRMLVLGEGGGVKELSEARQWSDRLGLNPAAMLRNRWKIAPDEVTPRREVPTRARPSARSRLKAVSDGA